MNREYLKICLLFLVALIGSLVFSTNLDAVSETLSLESHSIQNILNEGHSGTNSPKRVIVVNVDTLRADHLGTYGYKRDTSPFIDSFSNDSIVFENAVSNAGWTLAGQTSAITGTYPRTHRVSNQRDKIPEDLTTTAEVFKSQGYKTAAFTGGKTLSRQTGFGQGFDLVSTNYNETIIGHFELNFQESLDWIQENQDSKSYIFIHGYDMHAPYGAPTDYKHFFDKNYTGPADTYFLHQENAQQTTKIIEENGKIFYLDGDEKVEFSQNDIKHIRSEYDASIRYFDNEFNNFIQNLKRKGLYKDSVIVLTSSHGETLGENSYRAGGYKRPFGHRYLWESNIRVPMIVKAPGLEPERIEEPVSLVDLAPTIYDISDIDLRNGVKLQMQGHSLLPLTQGRSFSDTNYTFSQANLDDIAVRGKDWKLIHRPGEEDMLYSLLNGSEEIVSKDENPLIYRKLLKVLAEWKEKTPKSIDQQLDGMRLYKNYLTDLKDIIFESEKQNFDDLIRKEQLEYKGPKFELEDRREERAGNKQVTYLEAVGDSGLKAEMRIVKNSDASFAKDYIEQERRKIVSRFEGTAPYTTRPGGGECPGYIIPNVTSNSEKPPKIEIESYGFDDLGQGSCSDLEPDYRSKIWVGYCEETEKVFRFEVSSELSEDAFGEMKVSCNY